MFSLCHRAVVLTIACCVSAQAEGVLRVCADPNNLPFSNRAEEGFENRIAELIARELGARLEYVWWPQRKSAVKLSLDRNECDVLLGVPSSLENVSATQPYYRSSYVFVSRRERALHVTALSDPRFSGWRIGLHVVGDDFAPPAQALARRGLSGNLVGYSLFGTEGEPNPPARLITAVAKGEVDVGIAWGPLAGYFAQRQAEPLEITPVSPSMFMAVPFTFEISGAVRKGDEVLKGRLNEAISRECGAIQRVLAEYGVPLEKEEQPPCRAGEPLRSVLWH